MPPLPDIPVRDLAEDAKRTTHATDVERTALLLLAAMVAAAGLVLVGQTLTRTVYAMAEPVAALRSLGFTRANLVQGLVLPLGLTALTGTVVAMASAIALSTRFPVGLSRRLEPDLGVHADWLVLVLGAAGVVLLVLAGAGFAAFRAAGAVQSVPVPVTGNRAVRALGGVAPLAATIGAGLALDAGRGERSLPVRPPARARCGTPPSSPVRSTPISPPSATSCGATPSGRHSPAHRGHRLAAPDPALLLRPGGVGHARGPGGAG